MRKLLNMLKKDENAYSMGRVFAVYGFLLWSIVTSFLVIMGREWKHYDTFTMATMSLVVVVLCDKTFQSALFTIRQLKGGINE